MTNTIKKFSDKIKHEKTYIYRKIGKISTQETETGGSTSSKVLKNIRIMFDHLLRGTGWNHLLPKEKTNKLLSL